MGGSAGSGARSLGWQLGVQPVSAAGLRGSRVQAALGSTARCSEDPSRRQCTSWAQTFACLPSRETPANGPGKREPARRRVAGFPGARGNHSVACMRVTLEHDPRPVRQWPLLEGRRAPWPGPSVLRPGQSGAQRRSHQRLPSVSDGPVCFPGARLSDAQSWVSEDLSCRGSLNAEALSGEPNLPQLRRN